MTPLPNRIAVYLTAAAGLAAALAVPIANMDIESAAGVAAGLAAIATVVYKWLDNWGKYERGEGVALLPGEVDDEFDEELAEPIPDVTVEAAQLGEPPPPVPKAEP
jgi:hypothetical protein